MSHLYHVLVSYTRSQSVDQYRSMGVRVLWIGLILALLESGCAGAPPDSSKDQASLVPVTSTTMSDERDVLMGPPHLLSFTEEHPQASQEAREYLSPKVLMMKKSRASLAVIQLWFNAGPLLEKSVERGATSLLNPIILGARAHEKSVISQLEQRGATIRTWTTLDRHIIEIKITPQLVPFALELMGRTLRQPLTEARIKKAIDLRLSKVKSSSKL